MKRMKRRGVRNIIRCYPEGVQAPCLVLTALPVTQVSVQRLFSANNLLMTDLRSRLKPVVFEAKTFAPDQLESERKTARVEFVGFSNGKQDIPTRESHRMVNFSDPANFENHRFLINSKVATISNSGQNNNSITPFS